jgi:phage FluMu protein Com
VFITGKPKQEAIEIFSEAFDRVKCPGSKTFNQIAEKAHKDKFKLDSQYENEYQNQRE